MMDARAEATARMCHGMQEFFSGFCDVIRFAMEDLAKAFDDTRINLNRFLTEIEAMDPDAFRWRASGPIRRVQLRRARAMMEGKRHGV